MRDCDCLEQTCKSCRGRATLDAFGSVCGLLLFLIFVPVIPVLLILLGMEFGGLATLAALVALALTPFTAAAVVSVQGRTRARRLQ